jgi:polysaccharide export outer membrane protein
MSGSRLRKVVLAASSIPLLGVSACTRSPDSDPGLVVAEPDLEEGQAGYSIYPSESYLLRPNDVINVTVFREPDLTLNTVPVSGTGEISMPLLGPMRVTGLTASQLEGQLEEMLSARYLRFPDVTVNIVQYGSHQVTVEGAVTAPGVYNFNPGSKLSAAIALANGPSLVADPGDVAVFRQTPDGIAIAKFDYIDMQSGTMIDPVLEPGDRVVVGLNNLSQYWQDILRTLPAFAWFLRF